MMMNEIKRAAEYLMYKGPLIDELILKAKKNNNTYNITEIESDVILEVHSKVEYDLEIIDKYWYNVDQELYKQTITLRGKEKAVFDKYEEAKRILMNQEANEYLAS